MNRKPIMCDECGGWFEHRPECKWTERVRLYREEHAKYCKDPNCVVNREAPAEELRPREEALSLLTEALTFLHRIICHNPQCPVHTKPSDEVTLEELHPVGLMQILEPNFGAIQVPVWTEEERLERVKKYLIERYSLPPHFVGAYLYHANEDGPEINDDDDDAYPEDTIYEKKLSEMYPLIEKETFRNEIMGEHHPECNERCTSEGHYLIGEDDADGEQS